MSFSPYYKSERQVWLPLRYNPRNGSWEMKWPAQHHSMSNWKIGLIFKLRFYWHQTHPSPPVPLSLINYKWMNSSLSCYTNLTLNIVFIIKDVLAFSKIIFEKNEIRWKFTSEGMACSIDNTEVLFWSWWDKAFLHSTLTQYNLSECLLIKQEFFQILFLFIDSRNNKLSQ